MWVAAAVLLAMLGTMPLLATVAGSSDARSSAAAAQVPILASQLAESGGLSGPVAADARELLGSDRLTLCPGAREDLELGRVDERVVSMLALLVSRYELSVCPLRTGHYQCVGGGSLATRPNCTESHHYRGRGIDIGAVNGVRVSRSNTAAREIVEGLTRLERGDPLRPQEVGSPFYEYAQLAGWFTDGDHQGHIHLGFCGVRWRRGVLHDSCS